MYQLFNGEQALAKVLLLVGLSLGSGFAQGVSIYDATAQGRLSLISITDATGNDASSSIEISLEPFTGPYVSNEGSSLYGNGQAIFDGTMGSVHISDPGNTNPYDLEQRSEVHGNAAGGSASSNHSTVGEINLRLLDGNAGDFIVNFALDYLVNVNADRNHPSLESAFAHGMVFLSDSLGMTLSDGSITNFFSNDLYADASGANAPANDTLIATLLFSVSLNSDFSVDRIRLETLASGEASAVPVPAAVWMFGPALAGLGWFARRGAPV